MLFQILIRKKFSTFPEHSDSPEKCFLPSPSVRTARKNIFYLP